MIQLHDRVMVSMLYGKYIVLFVNIASRWGIDLLDWSK